MQTINLSPSVFSHPCSKFHNSYQFGFSLAWSQAEERKLSLPFLHRLNEVLFSKLRIKSIIPFSFSIFTQVGWTPVCNFWEMVVLPSPFFQIDGQGPGPTCWSSGGLWVLHGNVSLNEVFVWNFVVVKKWQCWLKIPTRGEKVSWQKVLMLTWWFGLRMRLNWWDVHCTCSLFSEHYHCEQFLAVPNGSSIDCPTPF